MQLLLLQGNILVLNNSTCILLFLMANRRYNVYAVVSIFLAGAVLMAKTVLKGMTGEIMMRTMTIPYSGQLQQEEVI